MHDYLRLSFHMSLLYHLLLQPRVLSKVVFQKYKLVSCCVFGVLHELCISAACDHGVCPCLSAQHLHNAYRWAWNDVDLFYFPRFGLFKFICSLLVCRKFRLFVKAFTACISCRYCSLHVHWTQPLDYLENICKCFLHHVLLPASLLTPYQPWINRNL